MARPSLPVLSVLGSLALASLAALALNPAPAEAQRSPLAAGEPCPTVLYPNREQLTCTCGKTEGQHDVWGTDVYTDDSAICHAAKHFGAIGEAGGVIHVRRVAGRASYAGSTRNGFTSSDYGAWERSIVFDDAGTVAKNSGGVPLCPVVYAANPGFDGTCECEEGPVGNVWGTNPYTDDSAVCSAAVHAGVIGRNGGLIHLAPAPGQQSYPGSTRNGFTTSNYGPWPRSFTVGKP